MPIRKATRTQGRLKKQGGTLKQRVSPLKSAIKSDVKSDHDLLSDLKARAEKFGDVVCKYGKVAHQYGKQAKRRLTDQAQALQKQARHKKAGKNSPANRLLAAFTMTAGASFLAGRLLPRDSVKKNKTGH